MARPNSGVPLGQWSGADATRELQQTIIDLDKSTKRQTKVLIWLTLVLVLMTGVLVWLTALLTFDPPA